MSALLTTEPQVLIDMRRAEEAAYSQGLWLNDLETLAHNEMMLCDTLRRAQRYHEAAFWASAFADAMGRLAEAHGGEIARREISMHGDWLKNVKQTSALRFAIRKDEKRVPGTETATIRNCRTNILESARR